MLIVDFSKKKCVAIKTNLKERKKLEKKNYTFEIFLYTKFGTKVFAMKLFVERKKCDFIFSA